MLDFFNNVDLQIIHKLLCDLMNFIINYVQLLAWSYTRENGAESFTLQQAAIGLYCFDHAPASCLAVKQDVQRSQRDRATQYHNYVSRNLLKCFVTR